MLVGVRFRAIKLEGRELYTLVGMRGETSSETTGGGKTTQLRFRGSGGGRRGAQDLNGSKEGEWEHEKGEE